jgi:hypothetical protein
VEDGAAQQRMLSLFPEDRCEGLQAGASIIWQPPGGMLFDWLVVGQVLAVNPPSPSCATARPRS